MKIREEIYNKILKCCPAVPPEIGGIMGQQNEVISFVEFDNGTMERDFAVYIPNVAKLNSDIEKWNSLGISFVGMFHSHPNGQETLSTYDIEYIESIYENMPENITELYFPIIIPRSHMVVYKAILKKQKVYLEKDKIEIV